VDAVVLDGLAAEPGADDFDILPRPSERLAPGNAVPALDDLRAGRAEAEQDAAARQLVERRRRHHGHGGGAGGHLQDRGADPDPLGRGGDP
jgi:hypothetical protein